VTASASACYDIVADILQRLAAFPALGAEALATLDRQVRRDWGGERPYIAKVGESARAVMSARDAQIRAQFRRGDHVEVLSRRHGISARRVQQILRGS
jgi:Mor family transcriptional regulator